VSADFSQLPADLPVPETMAPPITYRDRRFRSWLCRRPKLRLPTFEAGGMTLYKRLTFVAEAGEIIKAFYPIFPPDRNASEVLDWLVRSSSGSPPSSRRTPPR
jgi:hypothetical protein